MADQHATRWGVAPGISMALNRKLTLVVLARAGKSGRPAVGFTTLTPFSIGDTQQLRTMVESLVRVGQTWNGVGFTNFGLEIEMTPSQSIADCLERYRDGCPKHRIVAWYKDCNWLSEGSMKVVAPTGWRPLRSV